MFIAIYIRFIAKPLRVFVQYVVALIKKMYHTQVLYFQFFDAFFERMKFLSKKKV